MRPLTLHDRGVYGFTIVELFVVITALSILVTLSIFAIGDWRGRTAQTEVKGALQNAAAAMENARNFGTGYPAAIPSTYTASTNVSVQLMANTATSFCINGWSTVKSDVRFHITHQNNPTAGNCP